MTPKTEGSYFGPKHLEQTTWVISILLKMTKPSQGNTTLIFVWAQWRTECIQKQGESCVGGGHSWIFFEQWGWQGIEMGLEVEGKGWQRCGIMEPEGNHITLKSCTHTCISHIWAAPPQNDCGQPHPSLLVALNILPLFWKMKHKFHLREPQCWRWW